MSRARAGATCLLTAPVSGKVETVDVVDLGVFARAWAVQTSRIGWLLGAGASAAAGVPTAAQIVGDLLLRLYADTFGLVRQALDTTDPAVMARVRAYYDGANGMPPLGSPEDYSAAFAAAMPDPEVRRQYLRQLVAEKEPCFGQRVLGAAVAAGAVDLLVTTNFDDLIERAVTDAHAARRGGPARLLTVAALGSTVRATVAAADDDWPLLVKLHGDFREDQLKNLDTDLQDQDAALRQVIFDSSRRLGLAVAGYSGRDDSVMAMLRDATKRGSWPGGLWWLTRDPEALPDHVTGLLTEAAAHGVSAHAVAAANFDETMAALGNQVQLDAGLRAYVDGLRPRPLAGDAPLPPDGGLPFPVLRMNALPLLNTPTRALRVAAPPGANAAAIRERLRQACWRGAAVLGPDEVLALGSPANLQAALDTPEPPSVIDIDPLAAEAPPHVRALAAEALTRGLARKLSAKPKIRDGGNRLVLTPVHRPEEPPQIASARELLQSAYGEPVCGLLPAAYGTSAAGNRRTFAEGIRLNLERRLGVTWLLFVPFTWVEATAEMAEAARAAARDRPIDPSAPWNTERWVRRRFNEKWATIVAAWAQALAPHTPSTVIHALPRAVADLPDAVGGAFQIGHVTAYSREAK